MEPETGTADYNGQTGDQLTSQGHPSLEHRLDQLLADLSARWHAGDHRSVESELESDPSLAADDDAAAALIYREFQLRRGAGEDVRLEDFQRRYPRYGQALTRYAEAERFVGSAPQRFGPGALFGRFRIEAEIGRGGMGVVYRADDPDLNRKVALKLIRTGLTATDDELLRLRTEAEAAAHLDHANIIQVYETGESQGYVFLCLKYVDGQSLSRHAGAFRDKPRDAAVLAERIARAIHYAHQRGVLHRDLKPANILLDANRVPYVTDFGLAKLLDRDSASDSHRRHHRNSLVHASRAGPGPTEGRDDRLRRLRSGCHPV